MGDTYLRETAFKRWLVNHLKNNDTATMNFIMYHRTEPGFSLSTKTVNRLLEEMQGFGVLEIKGTYVLSKTYKGDSDGQA